MSIILSSVCVRINDTDVLNDISVCLDDKRIAVIGSNGMGKSTLARAMCGTTPLTSGSITAYGHDIRKHEALWRQVNMTFQIPDRQIIMPTVREELEFGLKNCGIENTAIQQKTAEALNQLAVAGDKPCHALSEGKKRMLCLLCVAQLEPKTIILDEPTTFLDYPTQTHFLDYLRTLPQQIIFITQNLDVAAEFSRAVCIDRGSVRWDGAAADVVRDYKKSYTVTPGVARAQTSVAKG